MLQPYESLFIDLYKSTPIGAFIAYDRILTETIYTRLVKTINDINKYTRDSRKLISIISRELTNYPQVLRTCLGCPQIIELLRSPFFHAKSSMIELLREINPIFNEFDDSLEIPDNINLELLLTPSNLKKITSVINLSYGPISYIGLTSSRKIKSLRPTSRVSKHQMSSALRD
jgi:hypothetical protein